MPAFFPALRRRALASAQQRFHFRLHRCTGAAGCRHFAVFHRRLRKDGIFLHDSWLCSPSCLRAALARTLQASPGGGLRTMPRLPRMPFRLILLQNRALTEKQLAEALTYCERTGLPLARVLLKLELVTPAALAQALAAENGCAAYHLQPASLAADLQLPSALADEAEAVTVHATAARLLIGFVHRIDRDLLRAVEAVTGRRAEPCFVTAEHRARQLALSEQTAAVPVPSSAAPELAALLTQQAIRTGADHVLLARVRDLVWARLQTAFGTNHDVLLRAPLEAARPDMAPLLVSEQKKFQVL